MQTYQFTANGGPNILIENALGVSNQTMPGGGRGNGAALPEAAVVRAHECHALRAVQRLGMPAAAILGDTGKARRGLPISLRPRGGAVDRAAARDRAQPAELTGIEKETMELLIAGLRDREAAERLGVARRTVVARVERIRDKLGAATRMQAAAIFARL